MEQYHYEFNEWEEAFKQFYRKRSGEEYRDNDGNLLGFHKGDDAFVFVISTASYTSGYWVEKGAEPDENTKVYKTLEQVKALERRIRKARSSTVNLGLRGVIV